jgi:chemotaxis protein methyltransferase CheR
MLLLESFPQLLSWNVRIEGTDISTEVVARAAKATYHRIEINRGLPARNIVRFFDHLGEDWTAKPEVRRLCNFRQANLCASQLPFSPMTGRFDVIFLRNVMLYFSQATRKVLLANIHKLLAPDGVLFLGSSEQPADPTLWTPVLANGTCYYQPRKPS